MNDRAKQRDALVQASLDAVRRHQQSQATLSHGASPRVGDVYLFPEPVVLGLRWVVADTERGEYFVVPADTHFLVGAADLVLSEPTQDVALVARCGFGCWLGEPYFQRGRWLTAIDSSFHPHLRERLLRARIGAPSVALQDGEVEADPLYQEWREAVATAVEQLANEVGRQSGSTVRSDDRQKREQQGRPAEPESTVRQKVSSAPSSSMRPRLLASARPPLSRGTQAEDNAPLFALEAVRDWVGDSEIGKGRLFAEGATVTGCVLTSGRLKACVKGTRTRPYRVWVQPHNGAVTGAGCTCPVGRGSTHGMSRCKHVAATLLAYLEAPNRFVKIADVYSDLEARDKAELLALIQQMLQRAPEVEPLLAAPLPGVTSSRAVPPNFYFWQTAEMIRGVNLTNDRAAREIAEWVIEMLEDNFAFDQCDQGDVFQAVLVGIARALQKELPENIRERVLCELPDDLRSALTQPLNSDNEEARV